MTEPDKKDLDMESPIFKIISDFIKYHGIAIFLVVFFVLEIYPEQQKEREEWINEISLLREALNPTNRSLTQDQARSILDLVSVDYTRTLEEVFFKKIDEYYDDAGDLYDQDWFDNDYDDNSNTRSAYINSQVHDFNFADNKKIEEVNRLYGIFRREAAFFETQALQLVNPAYSDSKRIANYSSEVLKSFNYRGESLYEIWIKSIVDSHEQYDKKIVGSIVKTLIENDRSELFDDIRGLKFIIPDDWHKERSDIDFLSLQGDLKIDLRDRLGQRLKSLSLGDSDSEFILKKITNFGSTE
jgi:hypothetical protein